MRGSPQRRPISREELQSLNEELATVNAELQESLEQQRRTSDELQNILNSSDIVTLFLDKDLKVRFFTPTAAPLFNLISRDIGRPLADLRSRFANLDLLADARAVLASSTPIKREATCEVGTWYICAIWPYRAQTNRVEGVIINFADVSNLKASEENLRVAHDYVQSIINTINDPLVVLDKGLRVVSASQSFYRFFGAKPEDTLGRLLADTDGHHLDMPALRAFLERVKSGNDDAEKYEITVDLPSLGQRSIVVAVEKIRGAGEVGMNILLTFSDVTDFKHAALELAEAKRAAEQANLSKSHFLAAASHDLRHPIQTLNFLCGTMKLKAKDAETITLLGRAERTLADMSSMLAILLNIDQLEVGAIQPEFADYPINELLDVVKAAFADEATRRGLGWRVVHCSLTVRTDQRLLAEMIRNLLANAFRYTDKGKILLGCRRHGDRLSIEIGDTGRGIGESDIPRIFQAYHKAEDIAQRGGLGLGLAIVRRLGELLGHAVRVRSLVGKGSVFSIEVPMAPPLPSRTLRPNDQQGKGSTPRQGSIFVIEDNPPVRKSLALMLRSKGHRVSAVANGETAMALVTRDRMRPDLVICDYDLVGEMNGVQAAAALRAVVGLHLPVIILTGDTRAATLREIADSHCLVLSKPVPTEEFSRVIQWLLTTPQVGRKEVDAAPPAEHASTNTAPTVFVVDDDRDARDAMKSLLTTAGYRAKSYSSARAFLESYRAQGNGCLITDVRMPGMNGLEMLSRLAAEGSKLPAIIITGQGDIAMAVQAMRAGAVDFIEKPVDSGTVLASIHNALQPASSSAAFSALRAEAAMRVAGLTKREREVMNLVVAGHANKEIAFRLGVSQRTVEVHRANVMKKMGAASLSDLVRLAIRAHDGGN